MGLEPYRFDGGTAVVTGAASGIGAALAAALAERGSRLGLVDRDEEGLSEVAQAIQARHPGLDVVTYVADLSKTAELPGLVTRLLGDLEVVTLLVNNAGVALGGRFDQISLEDFDWVMRINFDAAVQLTYGLLPALRSSPGSHLVNVSSVFGLIAPPGQSAYCASKFALRGFTEALRHELPAMGVGVTAVHPGGVKTRIAENARVGAHVRPDEAGRGRRDYQRVLRIKPSVAAEAILDAVAKRRSRVLIGSSAKVPDLVARMSPEHYWSVLNGLATWPRRATHAAKRGSTNRQ